MAGRPPQAEESAILKVASELFYRSGAKTSLREIAKRVGVTASAISQRFGSKQVLLETVLRQPLAAPLPPLHDGGKEPVELHELVGRAGTHYALHVLETLLPALRLSHQMGRQTGVDAPGCNRVAIPWCCIKLPVKRGEYCCSSPRTRCLHQNVRRSCKSGVGLQISPESFCVHFARGRLQKALLLAR